MSVRSSIGGRRRRPRAVGAHHVAALLAGAAFACANAAQATAALPPQIHTVAGGGSCAGGVLTLSSGQACDGIGATSTPIAGARSVSAMPGGGYLFVDAGNDLVREVSPTGTVTTVAGTYASVGRSGKIEQDTTDAPDGSIATSSGLDEPVSVAALPDGSFLITEFAGCRVRLVSPGGPGVSTITTIAGIPPDPSGAPGTGCTSTSADPYQSSGQATAVSLNYPSDAEPTPDGGVLIADTYNDAVRYVSAAAPGATLTTVAGPSAGALCDDSTSACDGVPAGEVTLDQPDSVSPSPDGSGAFLVAEYAGDAVRAISAESTTATFSTVVGTPGVPGNAGDGGPAPFAQLNQPEQVVSLPGGSFLIADTGNDVIREVSSPSGTISTIAGNGTVSFSGDGGAATSASLNTPVAVSPLANGNLLIADEDNNRIREITSAAVSTITVTPAAPNGGDGWYISAPTVQVSATQHATIQCALDPLQAPSVYGAIQPGCPYTGAGAQITTDGEHIVYAASQNGFGDQEIPISMGINIDTSAPTITCAASEPVFSYGDRSAVIDATLSDALSGPAAKPLTEAAPTTSLGPQTVLFSGFNNAGNTALTDCLYFVTPVQLSASPKATIATTAAGGLYAVAQLIVRQIPAGARVQVTCKNSGKVKGCPFAVLRKVPTKPCPACSHKIHGERMVNVAPLFKGVGLAAGTRIAVAITQRGAIGRYVSFTIRAAAKPARNEQCLAPGATKPGKPCNPVPPNTAVQTALARAAAAGTPTSKALLADPPKCLKRAGLGHIRTAGHNRWQGTIGDDSPKNLKASVFVQGPYASAKAATQATLKARLVELAYAGGPFVVTASSRSYLEQEASFAAACLASLTSTRRLHF